MAEQDDPAEEHGSKRNIILGYERVAGIENKLSVLDTKMDALVEDRRDGHRLYMDHEARIRALETTLTATIAAGTQSSGQWKWLVMTALAASGPIVALLSYFK